ncbi:hypothetical protein ACOMHN_018574 [Nucella lapillus]
MTKTIEDLSDDLTWCFESPWGHIVQYVPYDRMASLIRDKDHDLWYPVNKGSTHRSTTINTSNSKTLTEVNTKSGRSLQVKARITISKYTQSTRGQHHASATISTSQLQDVNRGQHYESRIPSPTSTGQQRSTPPNSKGSTDVNTTNEQRSPSPTSGQQRSTTSNSKGSTEVNTTNEQQSPSPTSGQRSTTSYSKGLREVNTKSWKESASQEPGLGRQQGVNTFQESTGVQTLASTVNTRVNRESTFKTPGAGKLMRTLQADQDRTSEEGHRFSLHPSASDCTPPLQTAPLRFRLHPSASDCTPPLQTAPLRFRLHP